MGEPELVTTSDRRPSCLARCCECFHLPLDALQALSKTPERVPDGPYIRDMLIWVDDDYAREKHRGWGFVGWEPEPGEFYFTCKHWDAETRLCTDYKNRPAMCRDYGTTQRCRHGCGEGARG